VFGDYLVFGIVPVPYYLPCNNAFQRRGTEERDEECTVASFLYRGKDANQCTKVATALVFVFDDFS
jgi:hypothetical protein